MIKRFGFTVLALCLFAATALAQTSNTGTLVGTVSGPDGAIPEVCLQLHRIRGDKALPGQSRHPRRCRFKRAVGLFVRQLHQPGAVAFRADI